MAGNKDKKTDSKIDPFTHWGDPILSTVTKPLTAAYIKSEEFKTTVDKMFKMIEKIGVGLAANQIGLPMRFAIVMIEPNDKRPNLVPLPRTVIVNPVIKEYSKERQQGWEGCLSCGGPYFYVDRAKWIDVSYIDGLTGKKVNKRVEDFQAVVFQHEIDHLYGKVCGEQVMVQEGRVVPGAIQTVDWYRANKGAPPHGFKDQK